MSTRSTKKEYGKRMDIHDEKAEVDKNQLQKELDETYPGVYNQTKGFFEVQYPCIAIDANNYKIQFPEKYGEVYYIQTTSNARFFIRDCEDYAKLTREYGFNIHRIYTKHEFEKTFSPSMQKLIRNYMACNGDRNYATDEVESGTSLTRLSGVRELGVSTDEGVYRRWLLTCICRRLLTTVENNEIRNKYNTSSWYNSGSAEDSDMNMDD